MTVGILVPDVENPLFPPIVRGMEDELARSGYTVLLANTDNDPEHERAVAQSMLARQIDGLAIASARLDHEGLDWLDPHTIPLVFVNRMETEHDVPWVIPDDAVGVAALMEHLFDLGHTKIAQVSGPQRLSTSRARYDGYKRELRRRGIKFDKNRVVFADAFSIVGGAKACRELLDRDVEFTAVFAGNDLIAIGCLDTLRDDGLRVPEDVSLAGYNDLLLVDKLNPSLTTVRVPKYEMGVTAARLLLARMRGDDEIDGHVKLEPQLIVRQSTGPPR